MSGRVGALALAMLASCYRPSGERACHVFCEVNAFTGERGPCPGSLTCDADGICRQDGACPTDSDVDAATSDGGLDAGGPDGRFCFGSSGSILNLCVASAPVSTLHLSNPLSTSSSSLTCTVVHQNSQADADEDICVVAARDVIVDQGVTLRALGTHPLVIVASDTITINGNIDVSAGGAGAASPKCVDGTPPSFDINKQSYGGGAGGSFQIAGAPGGPIYQDGTMTTTDPGGGAGPAQAADTVRAGCNGQPGAAPTGVISEGGPAGGAIYLVAGTSIAIADGSWINASGGGASVPSADTGGGGGGAGGLIGLDAPLIMGGPTTALLANGGGGACGGAPNTVGYAGDTASFATPTNAVLGGCEDGVHAAGGPGGTGAAAYNNPSFGQPAFTQGAGGGGGAVGWILTFGGGPTNFGVNQVSPPFSP